MFYYSVRILKLSALWADMLVLTLILYLFSWLPARLRGFWYFRLFRVWCKAFVRGLDVDLRLHQKNLHEIPRQYILIANHPSAFDDIGILALFEVCSLAKMEVTNWWILGRMSSGEGHV